MAEQPIRIPNLPMGRIVDEKGMPTDDELTFRQALLTSLQKLLGNQGVAPPSQTTADIATIAAQQNASGQYVVLGGTIIYDSTLNQTKIIEYVAGVPTVKTIQTV